MQFGALLSPSPTDTDTDASTSTGAGTARLETLADAAGSEPTIAERRLEQSQPAMTGPSVFNGLYETQRGESATSPALVPTRNVNAGFLGPTSFEAVYLETESSLASFRGQLNTDPQLGGSPNLTWTASPGQESTAELDLLNKGIEVLRQIPDAAESKGLFVRESKAHDGWNRLAAKRLMLSIHDEFGSVLRHRGTNGLREMATLLTQNTKKQLDEHIEDPDEWVASFSGRNLRWDALGIVFTCWAFGSFNYSNPTADTGSF